MDEERKKTKVRWKMARKRVHRGLKYIWPVCAEQNKKKVNACELKSLSNVNLVLGKWAYGVAHINWASQRKTKSS